MLLSLLQTGQETQISGSFDRIASGSMDQASKSNMTSKPEVSIPIIDLQPLLAWQSQEQIRETASQIRSACIEVRVRGIEVSLSILHPILL